MAIEKVEFEFPDEVEEKGSRLGSKVIAVELEPEIEVVDDTPEVDQGKTPMEHPPKDLTEEELDKYDDSVKNRIRRVTKGYHDERRAKEMAQREKEEAIRMARAITEENRQLKGSLSQGQQALLEQAKRNVAGEMEVARVNYKKAYELGDADALVKAQEALTASSMKAERVNNFKPAPLQETETKVQQEQIPVDQKALAWKNKNEWFGINRKMTAYALAVHEDLVQNDHVDPTSDEYYNRLGNEMQERFPDEFESGKSDDAPTRRQKSNVVAPATRSTAPRKIVLTQSQVNIAKRLGVPLELYARKVAEEQRKS
jgi:hypothetical protein